RLVELPDVDIVDLQAVALQQLWHRVDRTDAHFVRLAAGGSPGDKTAERFEAALFRILGLHKHDGRRAVRQLAGVAGRDVLAGALHRLELGKAFHRGVGPVAFVTV